MYKSIFGIFKYNPYNMMIKMAVNKFMIGKKLALMFLAGSLLINLPCFGQTEQKNPNQQEQIINKQQERGLAVLLIDMQEFYVKTVSKDEIEKEVPYQIAVLDYCKENNIPVFVLEANPAMNGHTIPVLKEKINSLTKKDYIFKEEEDGFVDTSLDELLKQENIKHVLLMGVYASLCVKSTAEGALRRGYNIMTSKDIIVDPHHPIYDESIGFYKKYGVYRDSHKNLLDIITSGAIEDNLPKEESPF